MKCLIFLVFVPLLLALDYSEEAKKYIDHNVDPCDNFYRHVCRMDAPNAMRSRITNHIMAENRKVAQLKSYPEFEDLEKDIKEQATERSVPTIISSTYKTICENHLDTAAFLSELETVFNDGPCLAVGCFTHLVKDSNCARVADHLFNVFPSEVHSRTNVDIITRYDAIISRVRTFDSLWAKDDLSRDNEFQDYFQQLKEAAAELIMETPWVKNQNVSDMILSVLDKVVVTNHLETVKATHVDRLKKVNSMYSECKVRYSNVTRELLNQYCLFSVHNIINRNSPWSESDVREEIENHAVPGASISYPLIRIGYEWLQMFLTTGNQIARLGAPGFTFAHELSHAVIREGKGDILSYFSEEVKECIQEQYRSSCRYFDEGNCAIGQQHFEENGADMFAVQVVWKLFLNNFAKGEHGESSEKLKQLFYAMGTNLCSGGKQVSHPSDPHAPSNIRMNAIVNHPAFQNAFQCSDDSRMMRSKTKQCSVYGQHAPPNRHRRASFTSKNLF